VWIMDWVARLLVVVGGVNWGVVGLFGFDLVAWVCGGLDFGRTNRASDAVYIVVGLAAMYELGRLPLLFSATRGRRCALPSPSH
jgi:uncharacterized membrane protein YuzA (DUF378 family)